MWTAHGDRDSRDSFNRQQQYHVRAFELISRALKLDEQNSGKQTCLDIGSH